MDYKNILFVFTFMFFSSCFNSSFIQFFNKKNKTIEFGEFIDKLIIPKRSFSLEIKKNLEEYIKKYSSLKIVPKNGDILIKGFFLDYIMTNGGRPSVEKFKLIVRISYEDKLDPKKNWVKSFSSSEYFLERYYKDCLFSEEPAIDKIIRDLTIKILNRIEK